MNYNFVIATNFQILKTNLKQYLFGQINSIVTFRQKNLMTECVKDSRHKIRLQKKSRSKRPAFHYNILKVII